MSDLRRTMMDQAMARLARDLVSRNLTARALLCSTTRMLTAFMAETERADYVQLVTSLLYDPATPYRTVKHDMQMAMRRSAFTAPDLNGSIVLATRQAWQAYAMRSPPERPT